MPALSALLAFVAAHPELALTIASWAEPLLRHGIESFAAHLATTKANNGLPDHENLQAVALSFHGWTVEQQQAANERQAPTG